MEKMPKPGSRMPKAAILLSVAALAGCQQEKPQFAPQGGIVIEKTAEQGEYFIEIGACQREEDGEAGLATDRYLEKASKQIKNGYLGRIIETSDINNAEDVFEGLEEYPVIAEGSFATDFSASGGEAEILCSTEDEVNKNYYDQLKVGDYANLNSLR